MKPKLIKAEDILPGDTIVWATRPAGDQPLNITYAFVHYVEEYEQNDVPCILIRGDIPTMMSGCERGTTWFALEHPNGLTKILLIDRK